MHEGRNILHPTDAPAGTRGKAASFPLLYIPTPAAMPSLDVTADVKLTHPRRCKTDPPGRGWRSFGGRLDVDPGGSSGSESDGPSGQGDPGDRPRSGGVSQHGTALPAWRPGAVHAAAQAADEAGTV